MKKSTPKVDHRYRGKLKFENNNKHKSFVIEQAHSNQKGGEGPYIVKHHGDTIYTSMFHGDCKRHIEDLVNNYHLTVGEFNKKWNLKSRGGPINLNGPISGIPAD